MKKSSQRILSFIAAAIVFYSLQTPEVNAAWGDFDPGFGFQGAIVDTLPDYYPLKVAVQPDGKILVTGYKKLSNGKERFFLRRYLPGGELDASFGDNGSAVSEAFIAVNGNYRGAAIVVRSNGKIAVSGAGNGYHGVWQFNPNGYGDNTIGYGGFRSLSNYRFTVSPPSQFKATN